MNDDIVGLEGLSFYGYHGVTSEEKESKQEFLVDIELTADQNKAAKYDDITYTADYSLVYQIVKKIIEGPSKNLLETLAETIASEILMVFSVQVVLVRVAKVKPPINTMNQGSAYVEIMRSN